MTPPPAIGAPAPPGMPERCSTTGLTKPECNCRACLDALVARYRPRPA